VAVSADVAVRARCGAATRTGGSCGLPAGHGTDHVGYGRCRRHGGNTPTHARAAQREQALDEAVQFGGAIEVGPIEVLLAAVYRSAGVVSWLRLKVEALAPGELLDEQGRPSVWVRLEAEWLDRAARVAKTALDAGVAERQVRIAERTGAKIAAALEEAVEPLELEPAARTLLVQRFVVALTRLEHTEDDGDA
jgi:hypothetical protein